MDIKHTESNELVGIDIADLEYVTGGSWVSSAWNWVKSNVGGLFGGGGGGTNVGVQNGDNNRQAQGNSGPTTIGDNSPIGGQ